MLNHLYIITASNRIPGETAKQIFERARLPNDVLGRIWNLADTEQKGALNVTEFIIAMHLLASFKSGQMRALPSQLPPGLLEAAQRRGGTGSRPTSGVPPVPAIPRQFSGPQRTQSPLNRQQIPGSPLSSQPTGSDWAISPQDKAQFDSIFATVDKGNRGLITGEQAVGFFSNSRLPEEALAQIWDLADINSEGQLNKDEFAVAMFLIRQQRSKRDSRSVLPSSLPPNLIPPSMRRQTIAPAQPTAPAFDNAQNITQPRSAADDLFGLDALTTSPQAAAPAQPQIPQSTGGSQGPFHTPISPTSTGSPQTQQTQFKPFIPSSSFGQSISTQPTGSPSQPRSFTPQQTGPSTNDDLLGDNDPEVSKRLTNETSELANLSNQVGTLSRQMGEVKAKRGSTEQEFNQTAAQKRGFETRLAQLRTLYEQEVKDVKALEERLASSRSGTKKLQTDIAMIEGSLQDLQNQHNQMNGALEADRQENASLKERIRQVNAEIAQLKPQLEKIKSEARQQKGLVAINKKQLATNEGEKEKVVGEIDAAKKDLDESARSTPPVASPAAQMASPAPSVTSPTNPFFRRTTSGMSNPAMSPSAATREAPSDHHNTFDSIFGAPFGETAAAPPPATSFGRPETPVQTEERAEPGDMSTPSGSPPPSTFNDTPRGAEPPPPPQSRQITSSFLPLRPGSERSDSISSSVKVAPPASRAGGFETPVEAASQNGDAPALQRSTTDRTEVEAPSQVTQPAEPTAAPDTYGSEHGTNETFGEPSTQREIPGAFPGDSTPPYEAAAPASTYTNDASAGGAPIEREVASNDPFAAEDRARAPPADKDGFDSAFEGFPSSSTSQQPDSAFPEPKAPGKASEFPPIQEFGGDEESDSESDAGFDDNFAPASPRRDADRSGQEVHVNGNGAARPAIATTESTGQLPPLEAQKSPPTYNEANPPRRGSSNQFPAEFTGLLPSREDPTSPHDAPHSVEHGTGAPIVHNEPLGGWGGFPAEPQAAIDARSIPEDEATPAATPGTSTGAPALQTSKNAFDDDFDDFENLGDEGSASNAAAEPSAPRHSDDFDAVFDKPQSAAPVGGSSRGFDDFNFDAPDSSPFGKAPKQPTANKSEDWDAIFSGLDEAPKEDLSQPTMPSSQTPWTQAFTQGPPESSATQPATQERPSQPRGPPSFAPEPPVSEPQPPPPPKPTVPDRPQLGRAITQGTEHDDPILKRLTGMGYPRDQALNALERYDYNLDKVSVLF